eukprot:1506123-Pleurochrysis_carterae.AAC.2
MATQLQAIFEQKFSALPTPVDTAAEDQMKQADAAAAQLPTAASAQLSQPPPPPCVACCQHATKTHDCSLQDESDSWTCAPSLHECLHSHAIGRIVLNMRPRCHCTQQGESRSNLFFAACASAFRPLVSPPHSPAQRCACIQPIPGAFRLLRRLPLAVPHVWPCRVCR